MTAWIITAILPLAACGEGRPTPIPTAVADSTFRPPASIDASGTTDVTADLNRFFATVPDSSLVELPAGARYRIEGTLLFRDRHGLTIEGNGATVFASTDGRDAARTPSFEHQWPRSRAHMVFIGGSRIVVRELSVVGANPQAGSEEGAYVESLEGQHGFRFLGTQGVELDHVRVTDVYGDFLYLGPFDGAFTRDVHVTDAHFERSGRQGIAITGAENVLIESSFVGEVARTVIDLEPNTANGRAWNISFRGNTFGACRHLLLSAGGHGPNVGEVELVGNVLKGMQLKIRAAASDGSRRGPFRIVDNTSDTPLGTPVAALRFYRIDGVEVTGNVQPLVPRRRMTAVSAEESCGVSIQGNQFIDATEIADVAPFDCPAS